jgi:hypothetical protein
MILHAKARHTVIRPSGQLRECYVRVTRLEIQPVNVMQWKDTRERVNFKEKSTIFQKAHTP